MAQIVLFHHVRGLSDGIGALAAQLSTAGHSVVSPDLFAGQTFATVSEGITHVQDIGFDTVVQRGAAAAAQLPSNLVYMGVSLEVMPAQYLAQTRAGARAAILLHAAVSPEAFGTPWPVDLPTQIHAMDRDPSFVLEGDIEAARQIVAKSKAAALYLYPGAGHLFIDSTDTDYDADATSIVMTRVLDLLAKL